MKILIVDDSAVVRDRLREALLSAGGMEIAGEARDAIEAERLLRELAPALVILDIHLPGGSGMDILQHIKKHFPHTIVLMFTNVSGARYREACMRAGADYFCDKSFEYETVLAICRGLRGRLSEDNN